jgi:polyisoprenoid-binding protein YceI/CheY-like chemotaxis protein
MTAMHLLVLERDPVRREALLGVLRAAGHQTVTAADAAAAAAARGVPGFDALVLDLRLPDLDLPRLREALVPSEPVAPEPLDAAERRHIALMLRYTGGNKRQAALLLGISRSTLLHKVRKYGLVAVLLMVVLAASWLRPTPLVAQLEPVPSGRVVEGTLSFDGHATAGDFVGATTTVDGELSGGVALADVRGWVEAPVRTLATGNARRDRDMNKSMESDKYPTMRFDLRAVTAGTGTVDSLPVTLRGSLAIHGVTRDVELSGHVRRDGERLRVRSDFPLVLTDFKIGGLSKMLGMLKMDPRIEVHVDVAFAPDS